MERSDLVRRAQRVLAAWNSHDPIKLALLYAPGCTTREGGQRVAQQGREGVMRRAQRYFRASINLDLRLSSVAVDGNTTFSRFVLTGTHTGVFLGVAPTGNRIEMEGCAVQEWDPNGYVLHETIYWDHARLLRSLGALNVDLG